MAAAGSDSPCRPREDHQYRKQNSNLIEQSPMRKHWEWVKKNEITRQTHRHPLLSGISELGMTATGSDSPCGLRVSHQSQQQNSNLIEKLLMRKHWEWGEENENTRKAHHRPLLSGTREWGVAATGSYSPC
jgi:hypothetical protein